MSNSQLPKPTFTRARATSLSASSVARALSPGHVTPRKRLYSEASLSPSELETCPKISKDKMDTKELANLITSSAAATSATMMARLDEQEKRIGDRFDTSIGQLKTQISEIREKQDIEVKARESLESHMNDVQTQLQEVKDNASHSAEAVAEAMEDKIEAAVSRHMKGKGSQINATYYQSLANDLKHHEKDLMVYGFDPEGAADLAAAIKQKLFKDKLELDIDQLKAVHVGVGFEGKPKPIRVSLTSNEIRNSICRQSSKLPKGTKVEKCLPTRYRIPFKEFREYSWQLKEANDVQTRVVFKGHKLLVEMKQHNEGDIKYDWTIAKEYFPQPQSPTDRTEFQRDRQGLRPSKTIEEICTNKVILSNLVVTGTKEATLDYFENVFLEAADKPKLERVDASKVVTKNILIVTLSSKQECTRFKDTYEKKEFNEKKPRISVMLGKN